MKILFSYELLTPPYDEGVKNLAYMIYKTLRSNNRVKAVRDISCLPNMINSLLIMPRLIMHTLMQRPEKIVYIPKGALTFSAILKIWLASFFIGHKLNIVSVQRKLLKPYQKKFVKKIRLNNVFTLSRAMAEELSLLNIDADVLPTGIDQDRFKPDIKQIATLRKKYSLPENKKIVLHVGHIRESRNILWLLDVQRALPDIQVVVIGSTATEQDDHVRIKLESEGVLILRKALPDIHEIYQASDVYCFTVTEKQGAMEIPLSVLEAMAINLPVISTRFGRLPELFQDDEYYRFVDSSEEIISVLQKGFGNNCPNRLKVSEFTWEQTTLKLINN